MNKNMLGLLVSLFMVVSCAVSPHKSVKVEAVNPPFVAVSLEPVQKFNPDTLASKKLSTEEKQVKKQIETIIPTPDKKVPYDTLVKQNANLQSMLFIMFNRGVKRSDKIDSLSRKLNAVSDSLDARNFRDLKFKRAQAKVVQVEKVNKSYNGMFNLIILICLVICTIHALLQLIPWAWSKLFPNKARYE